MKKAKEKLTAMPAIPPTLNPMTRLHEQPNEAKVVSALTFSNCLGLFLRVLKTPTLETITHTRGVVLVVPIVSVQRHSSCVAATVVVARGASRKFRG